MFITASCCDGAVRTYYADCVFFLSLRFVDCANRMPTAGVRRQRTFAPPPDSSPWLGFRVIGLLFGAKMVAYTRLPSVGFRS